MGTDDAGSSKKRFTVDDDAESAPAKPFSLPPDDSASDDRASDDRASDDRASDDRASDAGASEPTTRPSVAPTPPPDDVADDRPSSDEIELEQVGPDTEDAEADAEDVSGGPVRAQSGDTVRMRLSDLDLPWEEIAEKHLAEQGAAQSTAPPKPQPAAIQREQRQVKRAIVAIVVIVLVVAGWMIFG